MLSFIVQLSHPYMTTEKTIALIRQTCVGKVMSVLFNILSAVGAAESLQSCPTLCDPIDGSPPGSPAPGILQARTSEWVAISFSHSPSKWYSNHKVPGLMPRCIFPAQHPCPEKKEKVFTTQSFPPSLAKGSIYLGLPR